MSNSQGAIGLMEQQLTEDEQTLPAGFNQCSIRLIARC
jgi:hypothetical protein